MNVIQALKTIPDPRRRRDRHYPLFGLLAIVLRAAMHGERSLRGMWLWARARQDGGASAQRLPAPPLRTVFGCSAPSADSP